jgi:MFS family permease
MSREIHDRDPVGDETSLRYPGWRVVAVCFLMALFCWGFGFYGHSVYLAELRRLKGWPAGLISGASTLYYLFSASLVIFVGDAIARLGLRRFVLLGIACLGLSTVLVGRITAPWQLYADYLLMSFGWAAMSVAAITTMLGLWFRHRRGFAISLALNGASCGSIVVTPLLVAATKQLGFAPALLCGVLLMAAILVPMVLAWMDEPPTGGVGVAAPIAGAGAPLRWTRRRALGSLRFWTVSAAFAVALMAQVGFLVHQIAFLEPRLGRSAAGVAVAVTGIMAVTGRVGLGLVIDRLNQRLVSGFSFATQSAALLLMIGATDPVVLFAACALFGLSVGNVITLPALIIHREFDAGAFAMLIGFSTAIGQFTYATGPGLLGLLHDATGGYQAPLLLCAGLDLLAAGIVWYGMRLGRPAATPSGGFSRGAS